MADDMQMIDPYNPEHSQANDNEASNPYDPGHSYMEMIDPYNPERVQASDKKVPSSSEKSDRLPRQTSPEPEAASDTESSETSNVSDSQNLYRLVIAHIKLPGNPEMEISDENGFKNTYFVCTNLSKTNEYAWHLVTSYVLTQLGKFLSHGRVGQMSIPPVNVRQAGNARMPAIVEVDDLLLEVVKVELPVAREPYVPTIRVSEPSDAQDSDYGSDSVWATWGDSGRAKHVPHQSGTAPAAGNIRTSHKVRGNYASEETSYEPPKEVRPHRAVRNNTCSVPGNYPIEEPSYEPAKEPRTPRATRSTRKKSDRVSPRVRYVPAVPLRWWQGFF